MVTVFEDWSNKIDDLENMEMDIVFPSLYKTKSGNIIEINHLDNDAIKNCLRYVYYNQWYRGRLETIKYMKKTVYARMIRSGKSVEEIRDFLKVDDNDDIWWD